MFMVTMDIADMEDLNRFSATESGEELERIPLKEDFKDRVVHYLKEHGCGPGMYEASMFVIRDGEYYDHDEVMIDVGQDLSVSMCG